MNILLKYDAKILLALAAVMCFAASSMDYFFPTVSTIIRIMGYAFLVWAVIEPAREEDEDGREA